MRKDHRELKELNMSTTADASTQTITDREIGAAELQVAINTRRAESNPQWIRALANVRLPRPALVVPRTTTAA